MIPALRSLIDRRGAQDLLGVLRTMPSVARTTVPAFDSAVRTATDGLPIVRQLRPYATDFVGGQLGGYGGADSLYYDANGRFMRISFQGSGYTLNNEGTLIPQPPSQPGLTGYRKGLAPLPRRRHAVRARRLEPVRDPGRASPHRKDSPAMRRLAAIAPHRSPWLVALVTLGAGGTSGNYRVDAIFDNADFLISGQDVKIAGARVGTIEQVKLTRDHKARVEMRIDPGFAPFRSDADCTIRPQSLIGEKFVECDPGTPSQPPLARHGGDAPTVPLANTHSPVDLDLVFAALRLPYRQRLSLLVNELGTGLAGRPGGPERGDPARQPGAPAGQPRARDPRPRPPRPRPADRRVRHSDRRARPPPRRGDELHRPRRQGRAGGGGPARRPWPRDPPAAAAARRARAGGHRPDRVRHRRAARSCARWVPPRLRCARCSATSTRSPTPRDRRWLSSPSCRQRGAGRCAPPCRWRGTSTPSRGGCRRRRHRAAAERVPPAARRGRGAPELRVLRHRGDLALRPLLAHPAVVPDRRQLPAVRDHARSTAAARASPAARPSAEEAAERGAPRHHRSGAAPPRALPAPPPAPPPTRPPGGRRPLPAAPALPPLPGVPPLQDVQHVLDYLLGP